MGMNTRIPSTVRCSQEVEEDRPQITHGELKYQPQILRRWAKFILNGIQEGNASKENKKTTTSKNIYVLCELININTHNVCLNWIIGIT